MKIISLQVSFSFFLYLSHKLCLSHFGSTGLNRGPFIIIQRFISWRNLALRVVLCIGSGLRPVSENIELLDTIVFATNKIARI